MLRALALLFALASVAPAQATPNPTADETAVYTRLLATIRSIPIFDNHGHPGFSDDPNVDAMTSPPVQHEPLRLRLDNPELIAASRSLFDYPYMDNSPDHLKWLVARKAELKRNLSGDRYFNHILDQLNVETMVANRVSMPAYLDPQRFRWVFFVDSFLFPLNNTEWIGRNTDLATYLPLQEKKLQNELHQAGLTALPPDLASYRSFVRTVVEQNRAHGGVGIKFEIAYFRPLRFSDPTETEAAAIYSRYRAGGRPSREDYLTLQDYLFRFLLTEAGRLHLPVQIHTLGGIGDFYNVSDGNVMNLEPVLRDPRYTATTFVLLHAGYPFEHQAILLASRPNVFLDTSLMSLYIYPEDLKTVLRRWLSLYPDKVVFGSDSFPFNEAVGAEESDWLAVQSSRTALAAALAQMIVHNEITEEQAVHFAHLYLHDTAASLYPRPL